MDDALRHHQPFAFLVQDRAVGHAHTLQLDLGTTTDVLPFSFSGLTLTTSDVEGLPASHLMSTESPANCPSTANVHRMVFHAMAVSSTANCPFGAPRLVSNNSNVKHS